MVGINFRAVVVGFTDFHINFCFSSGKTFLVLVEGWHLGGLDGRQAGTQPTRLRIAAASNPELGDSVRTAVCASLHRDKHESQPSEPQTTDGTSNSSCLPFVEQRPGERPTLYPLYFYTSQAAKSAV